MMVGKEDLGLSLSLNSSTTHSWLNLTPPSASPPPPPPLPPFIRRQNPHWSDLFPPSEKRSPELAWLRGIDVNRTPTIAPPAAAERESGEEEEAGATSSPNSTLSSASLKRGPSNSGSGDHETERASSRGMSDEEDGGSRKKLRLSKDQSAVLEESFKEHNTLNPKQKQVLAKQLNLKPRQVEVWFQNRRARTKLKQTEVDCEFLKRCCENLTEENRRLQKEVQELRSLKLLSPQVYMHMNPPTTLILCPSCERVSNSGSASNNAAVTTAVAPSAPWAPIPVRPRPAFFDAPIQRS